MTVFVLAENANAARELCAGARTFGGDVALVAVTEAAAVTGIADVVYRIAVPADAMVESAATTVANLVAEKAPEVVLVQPTRRMKVIAAKVAAKLGTSVVPDVKAFADGAASTLYFGGIAIRKQKVKGATAIYTCGAAAFGEVAPATGTDAVEEIAYVAEEGPKLRSREALPPAGVDLTAAKRIIAAGRGFGAEEELQWARDLAAKVGGEVGCTRPLTEAETWFPRECYIGVSGLMLSPEVYFGIGVSGQMQHMVGVNSSKVIFAINKDKNAPIFDQADYGLVGDIKTVLPAIIEKL